ncbi:MAG: RNA polymerase sigma factor [Bacillaceae bacterium]
MEEAYIERVKAGDKEAFNELIAPYVENGYKTVYLMLRDNGLTEDAMQEAFIQTYRSLHRFDRQKASFKTWFQTIVVRTALKVRRKQIVWETLTEYMKLGNNQTPESHYIDKEQQEEIYEAISKLPMKQQIVIILFYYQEMSLQEIAKVLNISVGTVKSRLYHGREKLKIVFENFSIHSTKGGHFFGQ